jgi:hypothetical protein
MKTLNSENFAPLTPEELNSINGGGTLSSLNPLISGLLGDSAATAVVSIAGVNKTITDLTTNADALTGGLGAGSLGVGSLLGGGFLGGGGANGNVGGGVNL